MFEFIGYLLFGVAATTVENAIERSRSASKSQKCGRCGDKHYRDNGLCSSCESHNQSEIERIQEISRQNDSRGGRPEGYTYEEWDLIVRDSCR